MRTNIDIDDKLMKKAMKASKLERKTKKAVVEEALETFVRAQARATLWELAGKVQFEKGCQGKSGAKDKWAEGEERHQAYLAAKRQGEVLKRRRAA